MSKYLVSLPVDQSPKNARIGLKIDAPIQAFAESKERAIEVATNYLSLRSVPSEAAIYELVREPAIIISSYKEDKEVKFIVKEMNSESEASEASEAD